MRNPFRRPASRAEVDELQHRLDAFTVPADNAERRALAERCRLDPEPEAGYRFWRLAMPDIRAGFWATRRASAEGSKP